MQINKYISFVWANQIEPKETQHLKNPKANTATIPNEHNCMIYFQFKSLFLFHGGVFDTTVCLTLHPNNT